MLTVSFKLQINRNSIIGKSTELTSTLELNTLSKFLVVVID